MKNAAKLDRATTAAALAVAQTAEAAAKITAAKILKDANDAFARVNVRDQEVAKREAAVGTAVSGARSNLSGRLWNLRSKLRIVFSRRLSGLAALVLGKDRTASMLEQKIDPREAVRKEVAGLRLAESVLSEIADKVRPGDLKSDTAKLLTRAKAVVQANLAGRNFPKEKSKDDPDR